MLLLDVVVDAELETGKEWTPGRRSHYDNVMEMVTGGMEQVDGEN